MAGNPNFESMYSTTLNHHRPRLTDNVFKAFVFLEHLQRRGRIEGISGAQVIEPLLEGANTTFGTFSNYDTITITAQEGITSAQYAWKHAYTTTAISDVEEVKNSGPEQKISLVKTKLKQTEKSMAQGLNSQFIISDGSGNGGKDYAGLAHLVSVADSGNNQTVGGIDASAQAYWRPTRVNAATDGSTIRDDSEWANGINTSTRGEALMPKAFLGLTTQALYEHYEAGLAPLLRLQSNDEADARFLHLMFKGIRVAWDSVVPTGLTYFLNSEHMNLYTMKGRWMADTAWKDAPDKLARWKQLLAYGSLTVDARDRHVVVYGQTVA